MPKVQVNSEHAHVFANMQRIISTSRSFFGHSRGRAQVRLVSNETRSSYGTDDIIYIGAQDGAKVWEELGRFSQAHEYGHALQNAALGGIQFGTCPKSHLVNGAYDLKCAYFEGFANFHAVVVENVLVANVERNAYYPADPALFPDNYWDGGVIEGAVAAFLLDITDPLGESGTSEAHDRTAYPGTYVADLVRTCRVDGNRPDGIDYLVYCMENTVDPAVASSETYFTTRSGTPSSQQNSAPLPGGWSAADVRPAWKQDLYSTSKPGGGSGDPGGCTQDPSMLEPCA